MQLTIDFHQGKLRLVYGKKKLTKGWYHQTFTVIVFRQKMEWFWVHVSKIK